MQQELRQKRIEEYLEEVEFASLEEMAARVDASLSTVRRDLDALATTGRIQRTHGGARLLQPHRDEFVFSRRQEVEADAKERLGRACADLIAPGQNLFLDAGSTVFSVARHLAEKSPHIVTNSLSIANLYASHTAVEVVVSGGVIYPRLNVLVGPLAVQAFTQLGADLAILGGGGCDEEGIMNSHLLIIEQQKAMIRSAQRVIFCLDHTKIGRKSFARLCSWEDVDVLVTNKEAPAPLLREIRKARVEVVLA